MQQLGSSLISQPFPFEQKPLDKKVPKLVVSLKDKNLGNSMYMSLLPAIVPMEAPWKRVLVLITLTPQPSVHRYID